MFKGPSSFKPFVGSLLFGPLLAQFLTWGKCSKAQAHLSPFGGSFLGPLMTLILALRYSLKTQAHLRHLLAQFLAWGNVEDPSSLKPFVGSFIGL